MKCGVPWLVRDHMEQLVVHGRRAFSRVSLGIIRFIGRPSKFFLGCWVLRNTPSLEMAPERPSLECPGRTTTTVTSTRSRCQSYIVCTGPSWLNQLIQEEATVDVSPDWDSSKPFNVAGSLEVWWPLFYFG